MSNPVKLIVGGGVQCFGLPTQIRERAIKDLTFDNMAYKNAVKYGKYIAPNIHPFHEFFYYDRVNDMLFCPKGYIRPLLTMIRKAEVKYKIKDNTYSLPKDKLLHLEFKGKLRSYQEQAVSDMLRYPNGLLEAKTGSGKTIMAIALISKKKQPTLIIVHSKELLHQWCTRIRDFLGYQAGIIGDGQCTVHPITVGIAKSVKKHADSIKRKFGLVIVDECHKTPSTTFTECLIKLCARYTIGLSATPFRNDGLDRAINAFIGPTLHIVSSQELEDVGAVLKPEIYYVKTNYFTPKIAYIDIIQDLSKNAKRNKLVADVAVADIKQQNEAILIAVDRVQMGREISKILTEYGYPNYLLHGSVPSDKRKRIVADMRSGNVKILIATVSLIGEGFDMDKLHSLLLASPFKYPGRVIQVAGRVLRPEKGKTARIYDFRDDDITVLRKHGAVRQTVYKSQGWCH